jgi:hypothetical protein
MRKELNKFHVIVYDFNSQKFEPYDVLPYLRNCYKNKKKDRPVTVEEFKKFVKDESMYMFWARCEWEIILSSWPGERDKEKWDVYGQIKMNLDLVTRLLMEDVVKTKKK